MSFEALASDFEVCRRLQRRYGTTYYFATQRLPRIYRLRVHALYGFVRLADEWVDTPGSTDDPAERLRSYRQEFLEGIGGSRPDEPVLRAFCHAVREVSMPLTEPLRFLDAMERDLAQSRYETYSELREYMLGSASSVGLMMCDLIEIGSSSVTQMAASALGEAMQLTNFLRDVGEDLDRGRIYLPRQEMARFGVDEDTLSLGRVTDNFVNLMKFQINRARELYGESDAGIVLLPETVRSAVKLARILYSRILNRIEDRGYDVFTARARTSKAEKLTTALRVLSGSL